MKDRIGMIIIFVVVIGTTAFTLWGICYNRGVTVTLEAKVLTIESEILEGQLIGMFLGSSSGKIQNDVIKVGVSFKIGERLFLQDLKLKHAELAYYQDKNTLPLKILVNVKMSASMITSILNNHIVNKERISFSEAKKLAEHMKNR